MGTGRWWEQRRCGLLVQTNLAAVPAWAPLGQDASWYRAHTDGGVPDVLLHPSPLVETLAHHRDRWSHIEHYDDFFPFLDFEAFDADEWARLAGDAGMGYLIAVAKHHDGVCWWDAPGTDRTVLHDGPARNVLGELATACERAGLGFGTYYSLLDWADPRYPSRSYVDDVIHPQVVDLVERYGSKILWGDGHWGAGGDHWRSDELIERVRRIDPDIVVNDRWWASEPGVRSFDDQLPDDILTGPWEVRRGIGPSFGYNRTERPEHLMTAAELVGLVTEVVAKGGHLVLSIGADAAGRTPAAHAERLRAAGTWIRDHAALVDRATPWTTWGDATTRYLQLDDEVFAVDLDGSARFDALGRAAGSVAAVTTYAGEPIDYEQTDSGLSLDLHRAPPPPLAAVFRVELQALPPAPIELFPATETAPVDLAEVIGDARPGDIVQLGDGVYRGPARVPDGVTVRGLGPDRTTIDGIESCAVVVGDHARLEHCAVIGGGHRIVWLPKPVVRLAGEHATVIGCRLGGHVEVTGHGARVASCTANGVTARGADHVTVARSLFRGMRWDCAVELTGGAGHVIESCEFDDLLVAIRLHDTVGSVVRGNRIHTRWWGVHLIDTDGASVIGNSIEATMRAVDVDGGTLAEVVGNAVFDGDSGCVVQRGAADTELAGNHWERCRVGMLAWDAGAVRHYDNHAVDLLDEAVTIGP